MPKTWIIPDIHECANTLQLLVEQQIRPDKKDRLIFLGDYIDRGPDSKGVIDFIMHLQETESMEYRGQTVVDEVNYDKSF